MSKTVFKLWSIRSKNDFGKAQAYSRMNVLSIVTICEKFTTEVFSSFDTPFSRRKFPGACSSSRFDVIDTHMTVLTELRFIVSLWTTSTGRIFAGSDPRTLGSTAHQISPLSITNQLFRERQAGIAEGRHQVLRESRHTHHPFPPSRELPHNSDREASQSRYRSCCHRKYLIQRFAYHKNTANKSVCQMRAQRRHLFLIPNS